MKSWKGLNKEGQRVMRDRTIFVSIIGFFFLALFGYGCVYHPLFVQHDGLGDTLILAIPIFVFLYIPLFIALLTCTSPDRMDYYNYGKKKKQSTLQDTMDSWYHGAM